VSTHESNVTQLPGAEPRDGGCPHCLIKDETCRVLFAVKARYGDTSQGEALSALLEVAAATAVVNRVSSGTFIEHARTAFQQAMSAQRPKPRRVALSEKDDTGVAILGVEEHDTQQARNVLRQVIDALEEMQDRASARH